MEGTKAECYLEHVCRHELTAEHGQRDNRSLYSFGKQDNATFVRHQFSLLFHAAVVQSFF